MRRGRRTEHCGGHVEDCARLIARRQQHANPVATAALRASIHGRVLARPHPRECLVHDAMHASDVHVEAIFRGQGDQPMVAIHSVGRRLVAPFAR